MNCSFLGRFAAAMLVAFAVNQISEAAAADRVGAEINEDSWVVLHGNTHPATQTVAGHTLASPVPMDHMVLVLQPSAAQESELDELLQGQSDPRSPLYHKFLTPEEFGVRFGVSAGDINTIVHWLQRHGFTIESIPAGRRAIVFSGDSEQVRSAFRTEIMQFTVAGEQHLANANDPEIPLALSAAVNGILKLHNFPHKPALLRTKVLGSALTGAEFTYGSGHYLAPADFSIIYDAGPLYSSSLNGTGQSIAIVARSNINLSDAQSFRNEFSLAANPPKITIVNSDPGLTADQVEATLDTEWAGAVAPKATVNLVVAASTNTADGVDLSAQYIVNNNVAPIVSASYGSCEADMGTSELAFYNSLWKQAAAEGMTVFVAAGDSGAAGCSAGSASTGSGQAVNGLCTSPYSVCVGGTEFNEGSNPGQYWLSGNNSQLGSAESYIPETAWNESGANGGSGLWAGGGGASIVYSKPSWQTGPGVPNDGARDVPDVSLSAAGHDGYLIVEGGNLLSVAGTSAASPSFAGIMALVDQKIGSRQGNANPPFYSLAAQEPANGPATFHDVTTGNNSVPGVRGFAASAGYDQATGWGSVDAYQLATRWGQAGSSTPALSLTAAQTAISILSGQSTQVQLVTVVSGSFNSAVALSLTGLPAGLTASFSPVNIAAPGSGQSTLSLAASQPVTPGVYPITATARGGNISAIVSMTITIQSAPSFTFSSNSGSVSVAQGSSTTVGLLLTPSSGFNSQVSIAAQNLPAGVTASAPVTSLSGSSPISVSLTLSATSNASAGSYQILVVATGGGITKSLPLTLTVQAVPPTLKLSASQNSTIISPGQAGTIGLVTSVSGSFNSSVKLSISGLPSGLTGTFGSSTLAAPGSGQTTLTLNASNAVAYGTYSITVTAAGGSLSTSVTFAVTVQAAGSFTVSASNYFVIGAGYSGAMNLTFTSSGGFNAPLSTAVTGLPNGISFSVPTVTPGPSAVTAPLTFTTTKTVAAGVYNLTVTVAGGGISKSFPLQMTITGPAGCTLASNPSAITIQAGNSLGVEIYCGNVQGSFSSALTLAISSNQPSGMVIQQLRAQIVPGNPTGTATLAITSANTAAAGSYSIQVNTYVPGGFSQSLTIPLVVTAPNALLLIPSAQSVTVSQGQSATVQIVAKHSGTFSSAVSLAVAGLPSGISASLSQANLASPGDGSITVTIKATASAAAGSNYYFVFAAMAGNQTFAVPIGLVVTPAAKSSSVK